MKGENFFCFAFFLFWLFSLKIIFRKFPHGLPFRHYRGILATRVRAIRFRAECSLSAFVFL